MQPATKKTRLHLWRGATVSLVFQNRYHRGELIAVSRLVCLLFAMTVWWWMKSTSVRGGWKMEREIRRRGSVVGRGEAEEFI